MRGSSHGFVHRTFQEYFAAIDVLERYQQEDASTIVRNFLQAHVHDPHWREVILLLFGKLKHKFATNQLRFILEGKCRLSLYSKVVQQNLFFVSECLAEGITVEQTFAEQIVTQLSNLAKETPFASQRRDALFALGALLRTRQYANQGRQALLSFVAGDHILDLPLAIETAQTLYGYSPAGSPEQRQIAQLLLSLSQRQDLSLAQLIQVAETLYDYSPAGSPEQRQGAQLLLSWSQRQDLSLAQLIQVAEALYRYSPAGSPAQRQGFKLIQQLVQNQNIAVEQRLHVAITPCMVQDDNFSDRAASAHMLLSLTASEAAKKYLAEQWRPMPFMEEKLFNIRREAKPTYEAFVEDIPSIYELVEQGVVPLEARNELYELLRDMVPLFGKVKTDRESEKA